jgi:conjugative relaxase-like TrwC/TraI family protein
MISVGPVTTFEYLNEDENSTTSDQWISDVSDYGYIEQKSWWVGKLCPLLNLKPNVSGKDFANIFSGKNLKGVALLTKANGPHNPGRDLTWSPPKSVSVVYAVCSEALRERISWKNRQAVLGTLCFLEEKAAQTRCGKGGKVSVKTMGFVAAMFEHYTSRTNDMQLHIHLVVANLTFIEGQKWYAIDFAELFIWFKAAGEIYRSLLSKGLTELGFEVIKSEDGRYFEIKSVCLQICSKYSKRKNEITNSIEHSGIKNIDAKTKSMFAIRTREPKTVMDRLALLSRWQEELNELGMYESDIINIRNASLFKALNPIPVMSLLMTLTDYEAVLNVIDIYRAVAREAQFYNSSIACIHNTVEQILTHYWIVPLGKDAKGRALYTTQMMIDIERSVVELATYLHLDESYKMDDQVIEQAIATQENNQGFEMSEEQRASVQCVCQTGLDILQGRAGAGKSTSMQAVRIAYESQGIKVKGSTIAKKAAVQLENDTGIESKTLASTILEIEKRPSRYSNSVIVVDEAGLIPTSDLLMLMRGAEKAKAKVILVGETAQLKSIKQSGCLAYLSKLLGHSELTSIYRQRQLWARTMVVDLRSGASMSAINTMRAKGLLNLLETKDKTLEALIDAWHAYTQANPNKDWMIMAFSWKDVEPLNELVRKRLKEREVIGDENIEIDCVVSEKVMSLKFSVNDRVRFTNNDYERGFTNGDLGTVTAISDFEDEYYFFISMDNGHRVRFGVSDYSDKKGNLHLVHAYASTIYSSQGSTVDGDTFVLYTTSMDRAASYVAGSRHKDNCHWFVDGKELDDYNEDHVDGEQNLHESRIKILAKCMGSSRHKAMALEYLE